MDLDSLSYKELQDLAKEHGVKANQGKAQILEELNRVRSGESMADAPEFSQNLADQERNPETVLTAEPEDLMEVEHQQDGGVAPEQSGMNGETGADSAMTPSLLYNDPEAETVPSSLEDSAPEQYTLFPDEDGETPEQISMIHEEGSPSVAPEAATPGPGADTVFPENGGDQAQNFAPEASMPGVEGSASFPEQLEPVMEDGSAPEEQAIGANDSDQEAFPEQISHLLVPEYAMSSQEDSDGGMDDSTAGPEAAEELNAEEPEASAPTANSWSEANPDAASAPENAAEQNAAQAPETQMDMEVAPVEQVPEPLDEIYEKYWVAVTQNPLDFNTWVKLLSHVEKKGVWEKAAPVFDAFLVEFPLCFGYWCKLAEFLAKCKAEGESKEVSDEVDAEIIQIYERGVAGVKYSVDMWHKYGIYMSEKRDHDPEQTRSVYRRAVEAVGSDPKSAPLWRKYIKFEISQGKKVAAAAVYDQAIQSRISDLDSLWGEYKTFIEENQLGDVSTEVEYQRLKSKVMDVKREEAEREAEIKRQEREKAAEARAAAAADDPDLAPGGLSEDEEGAPGSTIIPDPEVTDEEIKTEYFATRESVKIQTQKEVDKRAEFEIVIKRPYFHVKPLDDKQLQIWREYLQFEENDGSPVDLVEKLYERCMVACANYSEFWIKYAQWKEKAISPEASHEVAHRACSIFLKYRPDIHLFYADLLESHGYIPEARQVYKNVTGSVAAGLVEAFIRFANFERRTGQPQGAEEVYRSLLAAIALDDPVGPTTRPYVALHFARFQNRVLGDPEGARVTLQEACALQPDKAELWLAALQLETSQQSNIDAESQLERVRTLFQQVVGDNSPIGVNEQQEAWHMYMEYVEDFCVNIKEVRKVRGELEKFQAKLPIDARKRAAEAALEAHEAKQMKMEAAHDANAAAAAAAAADLTAAYAYPQQATYDPTGAYQTYYAQHTSYPQYSYPQQY